jgi:ribosomal protein L37AE/L43A
VSERADSTGSEQAGSKPVEAEDPTLSRFDPMLRALMTFGLVEQDHDGAEVVAGRWHLTTAVQRRLQTLVAPAPPAEKLIYFGHRCSSCGEHAPTRISSGAFLCDACRTTPVDELAPRREPRLA